MADRVERLVRSRDELIQAVSHELGSPLSRIRFHFELLEREPEDQRPDRMVSISRELDALDDLVTELLGFAQSDDIYVDCEVFDPSSLIEDLAELARLEVPEERGLVVEVDIAEGANLYADKRLFQRAVENILHNGVRHADTRVRLEIFSNADTTRVAIHDDGPGIPEELREKVMTPFFRIEAERDRRTGGAGLGLAIVGRIMARHCGSIEIDQSPLGGASVTMVWPMRGLLAQD
jgi:signal transduction histidine kinase